MNEVSGLWGEKDSDFYPSQLLRYLIIYLSLEGETT